MFTMCRRLRLLILLTGVALSESIKEPELPPCPTSFQYFPQNLPMHCRMPPNTNGFPNLLRLPKMPNLPTFPPPIYQSPPPDKQPEPLPFPVLQGFPDTVFPPPPGFPGLFPGPPGLPGGMPMMPLPGPGPAHKLPVIVMPFYSPDPLYKKSKKDRKRIESFTRRPRHESTSDDASCSKDGDTSTDIDEDTDTSSLREKSSKGWFRKNRNYRRSNRKSKAKRTTRRKLRVRDNLLTPIIQYVTKDGYVIYEKEISKGEANEWLNDKNNDDGNANKMTYKEIDELVKKEKEKQEENDKEVEVVNIPETEEMKKKVELKTQRIATKKFRHRKKNSSTEWSSSNLKQM